MTTDDNAYWMRPITVRLPTPEFIAEDHVDAFQRNAMVFKHEAWISVTNEMLRDGPGAPGERAEVVDPDGRWRKAYEAKVSTESRSASGAWPFMTRLFAHPPYEDWQTVRLPEFDLTLV